jgi:dynamin 1-like protein
VVDGDFLARSAGICKCPPLFLQIIHIEDDRQSKEWAEVLNDPGQNSTDFNKIRNEIQAETVPLCGTNKSGTKRPIKLEFYSPNVLNLTLVDLAGLTKDCG